MIIFIILSVAIIVGMWVFKLEGYNNEENGGIIIIIGLSFLFLCLCIMSLTRLECNARIERIETLRNEIESIEIKNQMNIQIDRLLVKAIEENQWITETCYYKSNPWISWFYPATIKKVKYIDLSKLKEVL